MDDTNDVLVSPWVTSLSPKKTKKGKQAVVIRHDKDLQILFLSPTKHRSAPAPDQHVTTGFVINKQLTSAVDHPRGPMYGEPFFSCEFDRKAAMEAQRLHDEWHRRCFVPKLNREPVNLPISGKSASWAKTHHIAVQAHKIRASRALPYFCAAGRPADEVLFCFVCLATLGVPVVA